MLALLSPAKTLDFTSQKFVDDASTPALFIHSKKLLEVIQKKKSPDLKNLMGVSDKIADLNYNRYKNFSLKFTKENSRQAIFAFNGDVYQGLDANTLTQDEIKKANSLVAILSGFYGFLKPLDLIQPYRLEMSTPLKIEKNKNLYEFWNNIITEQINKSEVSLVINLASEEYFKSVNKKLLKAELLEINFKENKKGKLSTIGIFAKKARGLMARYIIKNNIKNKNDLKKFNYEGYKFSSELSKENQFTFIKNHD